MTGPLIIGIEGLRLTPDDLRRLEHPWVGGVILFRRNFQDKAQLQALTCAIHAVKSPSLLITVDQEGGRVQRFREGFTVFKPPRTIGALYDHNQTHALKLAKVMGTLLALELIEVGVDLTYAPVLDLDYQHNDVIGDRAWHAQYQASIALAASFVEGMHQAGLASVGKHFPGHGFVKGDTHVSQVVDDRSFEVLLGDIKPFAAHRTIKLDAMMLSHIVYPCYDSKPASLSAKWVDFCRRDLQFRGPLFTDDLGMAATATRQGGKDLIQAALAAGLDFMLLCNEFTVIDEVLSSLKGGLDRRWALSRLRPKCRWQEGELARWLTVYRKRLGVQK